jgi:galactonate dehydratase
VYRLFGGWKSARLRAYANGWALEATSPKDCARFAERVLGMGFTALKWDPFGKAGPHLDRRQLRDAVAQVRGVRDAVGPDVDILIEMHGRFNPSTALQAAEALAEFDCSFLEEPLPPENPEGLCALAQRISIPVAAGERLFHRHEFREILHARGVAIAQPDVCHAGGLTECRKIAALADTYQVSLAPHNSSGPVGTAAALHLGASVPNFLIQECFPADFATWSEIAETGVEFRAGYFYLSEKPGLGVELRPEGIARHPYRPLDRAHF